MLSVADAVAGEVAEDALVVDAMPPVVAGGLALPMRHDEPTPNGGAPSRPGVDRRVKVLKILCVSKTQMGTGVFGLVEALSLIWQTYTLHNLRLRGQSQLGSLLSLLFTSAPQNPV